MEVILWYEAKRRVGVMSGITKITISLPASVFAEVERERKVRAQSRSAFILRAVEEYLRREKHRADVEQYIRGYQEMPETEEEIREAEALAAWSISQLPWDDAWDEDASEESSRTQEARA
jgi:hypothetical protein